MVAAAAGLDKATARRLLLTMMRQDFVVQDPADQTYRLGRAIRELVAHSHAGTDLLQLTIPVAEGLAADIKTTVFLSAYVDGAAICLARFHDLQGIDVNWWGVGAAMPFNIGAAPKLLLALQPEPEIERVMATQTPFKRTPASLTDPQALRAEFQRARSLEYLLAVDDVEVGISALAVPLRRPSGELAGALSIAGLTPQLVRDGQPVLLARLQRSAREVERGL